MIYRTKIAWLVFVLVCSTYLLTFRGLFFSVDELSMFSVAESLVQTRSMQTPQLAFTNYHNVVGRVEPLYSLLAVPLYWLAVRVGWLGNVQTVMVLNVLITTATAVSLYALLLSCEHPPERAAVTALLYGLATVAWPYSRSFFREPLLAWLLVVAALGFVRWRQTHRAPFAGLALICLALMPFVKVTAALAWPAFALAFLFGGDLDWHARARRLAFVVAVAGLGSVALSGAFMMRRSRSVLVVLRILAEWADLTHVLPRLFGLTFGAGRGIFLFSPVLLLVFPGALLLWRRRRTEAILVFALLLSFLFGYSAYRDWHGGLVWGSRFLAPIIPLLLLPVADLLALDKRLWRVIAGVVIVLSVVFQFVAATSDTSFVTGASAWDNLTDYVHAPLVQQILRWQPANFDMLWWHGPVPVHLQQSYVNVGMALLPLFSLAGAAGLLIACLRNKSRFRFGAPIWHVLLGLLLGGGTLVLLWQGSTAVAGYPGINPEELRQVADIVNRDRSEPHVIATVSNDVHLSVLLNYFKGEFVYYWFSPAQTEGFDALMHPPLSDETSVRLIVDRVHMPPEYSGRDLELWLNTYLHRYFVDWVGGGYEVYSYLYPPQEMSLSEVSYRWQPGMAMSAFGMVTPDGASRLVKPGEPVWLTFHCLAWQPIKADYDIFVQFLSPTGTYVNGTDGAPQFGATMTSWWLPGETIVDRRAFFVPEDAAPGEYSVIAGFYANGERQPLVDAFGNDLRTHIVLGRIQVGQD
ncbi:MAG: hypothetical protein JXA89_00780 [Anaerolineae bacterium]|nr:hypothetical protein [Anaerolineae bacterium]